MYVTHVALDDFRSYRHVVVELAPGVTVFTGPNGQGKTNFVEAIAYLSTLSSHRVGADTALVRATANPPHPGGAVIRAKLVRGGRERILEIEIISGKANRARVNRAAVAPKELPGQVRTVTFSPEDLSLVRSEPGVRRRFLDEGLTQLNPSYGALKSEHDKIVRQRGALLKQLKYGADEYAQSTLEVWNQKLAEVAAQVIIARANLVEQLRGPAQAAHEHVSEGARQLELQYVAAIDSIIPPPTDSEESREELTNRLLQAMELKRKDEISRGVNLVGAHRDDLEIGLDHLPVRGYASHGESWSVALALRLGMFAVLGGQDEDASQRPILILDDVFAELDAGRREALGRLVSGAEQVLITAAVPEDLPESLHATQLRVRRDDEEGTQIGEGVELGSKAEAEGVNEDGTESGS
ncbi:DNA replication/repair protein RecF [Boudabousia marimammalium]|uniref:DNA replication and repair protein RecF n=1 Tax=Boudabousia marimammalium TaxID=156892 RepID=A0A1Q5PT55_9ACTO|nr:DNA replication/repair protein RecF [Boudabousia marimammalium]OKL50560.1 DNA replication/repair protein RecF [Boudabousia marimammalium]